MPSLARKGVLCPRRRRRRRFRSRCAQMHRRPARRRPRGCSRRRRFGLAEARK